MSQEKKSIEIKHQNMRCFSSGYYRLCHNGTRYWYPSLLVWFVFRQFCSKSPLIIITLPVVDLTSNTNNLWQEENLVPCRGRRKASTEVEVLSPQSFTAKMWPRRLDKRLNRTVRSCWLKGNEHKKSLCCLWHQSSSPEIQSPAPGSLLTQQTDP